jgi:hypothetical protein
MGRRSESVGVIFRIKWPSGFRRNATAQRIDVVMPTRARTDSIVLRFLGGDPRAGEQMKI